MENQNTPASQGLDENYFQDNYQPMFNKPAEAPVQPEPNNWEQAMADVPPMGEAQEVQEIQDNRANENNKEKRPAAKKVLAIALTIAIVTGASVAARNLGKDQDKKPVNTPNFKQTEAAAPEFQDKQGENIMNAWENAAETGDYPDFFDGESE